jgi:hypothetical protein
MATRKTTKATTKADQPEVKASKTVSLDEYIKKHKPHYGLVASFKHEASKTENGLADRTEAEWKDGFEAQSKKTY